jgi:hypothetical protein
MKQRTSLEIAASTRSILAIVARVQKKRPNAPAYQIIEAINLAIKLRLAALQAKPFASLTEQQKKRLELLETAEELIAGEQKKSRTEQQLELPINHPLPPNTEPLATNFTPGPTNSTPYEHPKSGLGTRGNTGNYLIVLFILSGSASMIIASLLAPKHLLPAGTLGMLGLLVWLAGKPGFNPRHLEKVAVFVGVFVLPLLAMALIFAVRGKWAGVAFLFALSAAVFLTGAVGRMLAKSRGWDEVETAMLFGLAGLFIWGGPLAVNLLR